MELHFSVWFIVYGVGMLRIGVWCMEYERLWTLGLDKR